MEDKLEVADIFRLHKDAFLKKYGASLNFSQKKTIESIIHCRTSKLGGHVDECDACGKQKISYNSCRNRHCPKCQSLSALKWITDRTDQLLSINHFHVAFTVPEELNPIIYRNKRIAYDILFQAASQALKQEAEKFKYLKAKMGFIGILHSWGQKLPFHPHIHFLVTSGGLSLDNNNKWIYPKYKKYLMPVKVLSKRFKEIFVNLLEKKHSLCDIKTTHTDKEFKSLIEKMKRRKWVVYSKPTINTPEKVLEYFGNYTHRVAISNQRIIRLENGMVYFKWRDYSDNNKKKITSLDAVEFIRRFLLHILPDGYVKIRYYGLYANRNREAVLKHCRSILGLQAKPQSDTHKKSWKEILLDLRGIDITLCTFCKKGTMIRKEQLEPIHNNSPPSYILKSFSTRLAS